MRKELCQPVGHKEEGFTLLEIMIVLTVFTVCFGAALIPLRTIAEDVRNRQFFHQVERDLFAAQAYAVSKNANIVVDFFENKDRYYHIYTFEIPRKTIIKREIPEHFTFDERGLDTITFLKTGTTSRFGTFYFTTNENTTKLIFLIGRGRFYFSEE
ncbi:prepilin-type N-terminal cleavage/methylation domain-containing protein [Domibacillus sp. PGB-M46]|uniref:competence type IV pilus minor pilin ComGD n=1 Tax=Domibacillus sp. PGB-M46 TaxID=2910255 RepID=UPI001F55EDEE|nr:competence type IV pilus minor pilin ComGD [Domibacillus sp. PGB-M46]MCI2254563.1 prepilin-type N-terminal cleavage/methylation domain-containing protein [Domibacillus sp. PGB-M46]